MAFPLSQLGFIWIRDLFAKAFLYKFKNHSLEIFKSCMVPWMNLIFVFFYHRQCAMSQTNQTNVSRPLGRLSFTLYFSDLQQVKHKNNNNSNSINRTITENWPEISYSSTSLYFTLKCSVIVKPSRFSLKSAHFDVVALSCYKAMVDTLGSSKTWRTSEISWI